MCFYDDSLIIFSLNHDCSWREEITHYWHLFIWCVNNSVQWRFNIWWLQGDCRWGGLGIYQAQMELLSDELPVDRLSFKSSVFKAVKSSESLCWSVRTHWLYMVDGSQICRRSQHLPPKPNSGVYYKAIKITWLTFVHSGLNPLPRYWTKHAAIAL